jgi:hypothetical protein
MKFKIKFPLDFPHSFKYLIALFLFIWNLPSNAFVFLDTSAEKIPVTIPDTMNGNSSKESSIPAIPASRQDPPLQHQALPAPLTENLTSGSRLPHYDNVLFMSSDNQLVYAYVGVIKALEEFGLDVDLVLAESKASIIGAWWALGYTGLETEKWLAENPLEYFMQPYPDYERLYAGRYKSDEPSPVQWHFPLSLDGLQSPDKVGSLELAGTAKEFLHLSWMVAKVTHDAPGGPVEDLVATPKPLAVQVTDLSSAEESVITEGSLQDILKGSLLPTDIVRQRKKLWPYASGSLTTGHKALNDRFPFTFDRIIVIQPGPRLRPSPLDGVALTWRDSLDQGYRNGSHEFLTRESQAGKLLIIKLDSRSDIDPEDMDPKKWIDLGYLSALRSIDVLRSALSPVPEIGMAPGATPAPVIHTSLGLNRVTVNSLASGGRQLLLDIIRTSEHGEDDSVGDASISAITQSGFYSDLDLEWTRALGESRASLVFDARDRSRLRFRAGWNIAWSQAEFSDRGPEAYAGLNWDEPFYIPFRSQVGILFGGHQPGYEFRAQITPVYPLRLDLGISAIHWENFYPTPSEDLVNLDPIGFRLRRTLSQVFLKIYPISGLYLRTAIQKHEMSVPLAANPIPLSIDPGLAEFQSTDFDETAFLGLGRANPSGHYPHAIKLRYRNVNRVNLFGPIKDSTSSFEARLRISFGDFRISNQYYWSSQKTDAFDIYDIAESGHIDVFTFQDEFFMQTLRSAHFHDVKLEYCPTFGQAGLRLVAGVYSHYGTNAFTVDQLNRPLRKHWEAQAGYAMPFGFLRGGMGTLDGESPVYFIKLGADLALGFGEGN